MADGDGQGQAQQLEAALAARWPDATGAQRAATDETHRVVVVHPLYDGFVSLEVTARTDLDAVFVMPDEALARVVTAHHRTGPLERGQVLPIDLELHPLRAEPPASSGLLELVDPAGDPVAPPVRLTLATSFKADCELAGEVDGPWPAAELREQVDALLGGRLSATRLSRRIARATAGSRGLRGWLRR